jgi:CBS domain containing-hemolysin-like protein
MMTNLFAFDVRTVARVMIPRGDIVALDLQASNAENLQVLTDSGHSRFPVVDGDSTRFSGIVLTKDLYAALLKEGDAAWDRLREFVREPLVVPEILRVALLFETMRQGRAHMALVVDEYGETAGLVTMEDLLEELIGNFEDESDRSVTGVRTRPGGILVLPGSLRPHELADAADIALR